uniref:GCR034 n=1 Tax=Schmidtea mediterranea TaxID=79327 RepID=A0A193KU78_SCHMD|nr:GCR034 [Schmidtea mediterranea]
MNCTDSESCKAIVKCDDYVKHGNNYLVIPMGIIVIFAASFGNGLVIISVWKYPRLRRQITNHFVFSLAFADFLVAILVMPFNLIQTVNNGRWLFGPVLCNIFNSNDVFFSTASLIHIGCIGLDRYIAIIKPFKYEIILTNSRVAIILTVSWITSLLISHIPIHSGIYTTEENLVLLKFCRLVCHFKVNMIYAIVSSTISFWIPSSIMCVVYLKIFKEAKNQEKKIILATPYPKENRNSLTVDMNIQSQNFIKKSLSVSSNMSKRNFKREHKAAKTLGIIMGCFIACWLPFFIWYTVSNVCQSSCSFPEIIGDIVFWIGYVNSTLNPIIYAFYNREFRKAFKQVLKYNKWCCKNCTDRQCNSLNTHSGNFTNFTGTEIYFDRNMGNRRTTLSYLKYGCSR